MIKKECKWCDFKNAIRKGGADYRCPRCDRNLMFEMVSMADAGIDYSEMEGEE